MKKEKGRPVTPMGVFFKIGDKVTKGDPMRKLDFDYYMMWIIFLAFFFVFLGNIYNFFTQGYQIAHIGWGLFALAVMWFQYSGLKSMYEMRKLHKGVSIVEEDKPEPVDEMLKEFQNEKHK